MDSLSTVTPGGPATVPGPQTPLPHQLGRYRLERTLGSGGMGSVWLAHDTVLDRPVAMKIPRLERGDAVALERFHREAQAAATLSHPNLCPVHDVGVIDGIPYMSMGFIEGKPLSELLASGKLASPAPIAALVAMLARGMDEAHKCGVVHRDLKPANVMINRRNEPVVVDFGLARRSVSGGSKLTRDGTVMGTPAYMSPEQARGETAAVGPASDIYSLGVILYELLVGRPPFSGSPYEVVAMILRDEAPPPSTRRAGIPQQLEQICIKAMSKHPEKRFASMGEFAAALEGFLERPSSETVQAMKSVPAVPAEDQARFYATLARQFYAELGASSANLGPAGGSTAGKVGLSFGLVLALLGLGLARWGGSPVTVQLRLEGLRLEGPAIQVMLDGNAMAAGALAEPLSLKAGEHELVMLKDGKEVQRKKFTVSTQDDQTVKSLTGGTSGKPTMSLAEAREKVGGSDVHARRIAAARLAGSLVASDQDSVIALISGEAGELPSPGDATNYLELLETVKPGRRSQIVIRALKSEKPPARAWGAERAKTLKITDATPVILDHLVTDEGHAHVAYDKTYALEALKVLAPEKVDEALLAAAKSPRADVRNWATTRVGERKIAAAAPLMETRIGADTLYENLTYDKTFPLNILSAVAPDRIPRALGDAFRSAKPEVRRWAAEKAAEHRVREFVRLLSDRLGSDEIYASVATDKAPVLAALLILDGSQATSALLKAFQSVHPEVREWAVERLGERGDAAAAEVLYERVATDKLYTSIRTDKTLPLGVLEGLAAERAVPALGKAFGSDKPEVRRWACENLGKRGGPEAIALLSERLGTDSTLSNISIDKQPVLTALKAADPAAARAALERATTSRVTAVRDWAKYQLAHWR